MLEGIEGLPPAMQPHAHRSKLQPTRVKLWIKGDGTVIGRKGLLETLQLDQRGPPLMPGGCRVRLSCQHLLQHRERVLVALLVAEVDRCL
jgi:hypothetical protein